ncbi:MAG: hypothetical protein ACHQAY_24700 [Hyphomicrobiales bacterium]
MLALAAVVSACVTTEQAATALRSKWVGQSADAFFLRYGAPAGDFKLANGDTIYTWTGGQATYTLPAVADTTFGPGGTATTTISGGGDVHISCTLQITTSGPERTIKSISPSRDTGGPFSLSRCADVFS